MTTIKRFTPDYKMHAVRFEAFAREAEHGEYVKFDAHQRAVSALEAERDEQQKRADALEVRLRNALSSEQEAIQRAHAANQTADALAVENARCKFEVSRCHQTIDEMFKNRDKWIDKEWLAAIWSTSKRLMNETPATDAALAAIRARAKAEAFAEIIEFIDRRSGLAEMKTPWDLSSAIVAHIAELREGK
ncbi:hypothetical protein [Serratia marcescens]|uniref:hypothetical protein n=1 Tax=Serratia marcescens TaxID=615 RepID=UPI003FA7A24A